MIVACSWRAYNQNTLRGFATLVLRPSGLVLRECSVHEKDGRRWIALPARPKLGSDGRQLKSPKDNRPVWSKVIDFDNKEARERFQIAALAAIDELLRGRAR